MNADLEMVLRLLLATFLGAVVGLQRQLSGKEAGLRTNMLICLGSSLFTVLSIYAFPGSDPARIAAGVAAGIGFIGAGVILYRTGGEVSGLTTAATIWAVAGVGIASGAGLYYIAPAATVLVLIILMLPHVKKRAGK
ncbi:MAG: MgtC/SapB family protein [Dehalococcoidales bacterium]|nr:MgtC/SapB family protein [Dehalococcoidales bacterium]